MKIAVFPMKSFLLGVFGSTFIATTIAVSPNAGAMPGNDIYSMCPIGYQLALNPPLCGAREAVNEFGDITTPGRPVNLFREVGWNQAELERIAALPPCGGFYYGAPWQEYNGGCKPSTVLPIYDS